MLRTIEQAWHELQQTLERPAFLRIDDEHPLDLYAVIGPSGERALMFVTPTEPPTPPTYDTIHITTGRRSDRQWSMQIQLTATDLIVPFGILCNDLVESTRHQANHDATLLLDRLSRWRRLLHITPAALSEQELRGLIGELLVLKHAIQPRFGATAALQGWVGPYDAPQDFVVNGIAIEAKAIMPAARTIKVSSLDQLDAENAIILATVGLSPASPHQNLAFTPAQLIEEIRIALGSALEDAFRQRLAASGYAERSDHERLWYRRGEFRYYRVTNHFPRLTRTIAPAGILDARYDIDIRHCTTFEIPENASWT